MVNLPLDYESWWVALSEESNVEEVTIKIPAQQTTHQVIQPDCHVTDHVIRPDCHVTDLSISSRHWPEK